jgi:hypothetical protein
MHLICLIEVALMTRARKARGDDQKVSIEQTEISLLSSEVAFADADCSLSLEARQR